MKTLLELYDIAQTDQIHLDSFSLPQNESVSLMDSKGQCYIALDTKKMKNGAEEKLRLAHELGHCETGSFYNEYSTVDLVGKHENAANRWAYDQLIPFEELNEAVTSGKTEMWQLAEYFDVPESYIRGAIRHYIDCLGLHFSRPAKCSSEEESSSHVNQEALKNPHNGIPTCTFPSTGILNP